MAFRVFALLVGVSVGLYRYFKHRDEWQACAFYGFLALSAVHAVAGLGQDGGEPDYFSIGRIADRGVRGRREFACGEREP